MVHWNCISVRPNLQWFLGWGGYRDDLPIFIWQNSIIYPLRSSYVMKATRLCIWSSLLLVTLSYRTQIQRSSGGISIFWPIEYTLYLQFSKNQSFNSKISYCNAYSWKYSCCIRLILLIPVHTPGIQVHGWVEGVSVWIEMTMAACICSLQQVLK